MIIFCFFIYSEEIVVVVATAIAILDVIFIIVCVPESLPDKCRPIASSRGLTFDQVRKCQKHLYDQTNLILMTRQIIWMIYKICFRSTLLHQCEEFGKIKPF